jgi:anti-sigma regulatory factor (Ser/Thr protein kinase)
MEPSAPSLLAAQVLWERSQIAIPSLPHWIEPTVEFLRHKAVQCGACHESRAAKLLVALLEAVTNAVVHGNLQIGSELKECGDDAFARLLAERAADPEYSARTVDIVVDYDGGRCQWVITDQGAGFDVERVLKRCLSDDPQVMLASGRGILMMHSFLDEVRYDLGGRRLILTLNRSSGIEKRREPRLPIYEPVRIAPMQPDGTPDLAAASLAVSNDFSSRGVALIKAGLATGQRIFIGVPIDGETVYLPAAVRHCRNLAEGCVQLGCEFEIVPSASASTDQAASEELGRLHHAILDVLARFHAPAVQTDERRAHPRVAFNQPVSIDPADGGAPVTAYARDLSKGGMAAIARVPLTGAVVVSLAHEPARPEPARPEPARPVRIRARVVRCNRVQEGFYDIGLQFLRLAPQSS